MILPDHLGPGLRLVFCGTAPGRASAAAGHYYANPGNRFWAVLQEVGLTPRRLGPHEDHRMPEFGLGLTDLCKTRCGQDAELPPEAFDAAGLFARLSPLAPRGLAFTSLRAAREATGDARLRPGRLPPDPRLPGAALFALPSPSGLARRHFDIGPWRAAAAFAAAATDADPRPEAVPPACDMPRTGVPAGRDGATASARRAGAA